MIKISEKYYIKVNYNSYVVLKKKRVFKNGQEMVFFCKPTYYNDLIGALRNVSDRMLKDEAYKCDKRNETLENAIHKLTKQQEKTERIINQVLEKLENTKQMND